MTAKQNKIAPLSGELLVGETLDLTEAAAFVGHKVSDEAIRKALASGELRGRNLGGNVGWITTKDALTEWVKGGNARAKR
jgi:hypothetical protein